jgi:hypothetical protein
VLAFGFGGFVTGFSLTSAPKESTDHRRYPAKMNFPAREQWRPCHQLLLTLGIASYAAAHAVFQVASGGSRDYISSKIVIDVASGQNSLLVVAWLLTIFASGLLNGLLCTGAQITLRAGNMDGHVLDVFMGLADAACSRSLRFMWRVRAQMVALVAFFLGCCIGSLVFQSALGASALGFACIALLPLWILGIVLLASRFKSSRTRLARPSDMAAAYVDSARGATAQLRTPSSGSVSSHASLSQERGPVPLDDFPAAAAR